MPEPSASDRTDPRVDARIQQLTNSGDWRGPVLDHIRRLTRAALPAVVEEIKWVKPSNPAGVPVFSNDGILFTLETYKAYVKLTFAKGAALPDPADLFNASLEGNARRAIDLRQHDRLNEPAFQDLVRAAASLTAAPKPKATPKPKAAPARKAASRKAAAQKPAPRRAASR